MSGAAPVRRVSTGSACTAAAAALAVLVGLTGCAVQPPPARELPTGMPQQLAAWQLFELTDSTLRSAPDAVPYRLATPLFTDHAWKLRTVRLPAGTSMTAGADGRLSFPVGTVIAKTFYYPRGTDGALTTDALTAEVEPNPGTLLLDRVRLIETRLLIHREDGWEAAPYVWNAAGTAAQLRIEGDYQPLTVELGGEPVAVDYMVPDRNQCGGCHVRDHAGGALEPLGPRLQNLQVDYRPGTLDQITAWQDQGLLSLDGAALPEAFPEFDDIGAATAARARAYLDVNCAHCHHAAGAADTSGLFLPASLPLGTAVGRCKPPVAAGRGSGGLRFDIAPGASHASILVHRMRATDPGVMMPELGRSTVHEAGVQLVSDWIDAMPGDCGSASGERPRSLAAH